MKPFGTEFCDHFAIARYSEGAWSAASIEPLKPLQLHPAAHVFHYASTCFEGFKAYRWADGKGRIFRLHDHVARMQRSAASLCLPVPDADQLASMVVDLVHHNLADIPEPPASLYLRPTLIGTLENIGAAAAPSHEALLYVLASPVGDYFAGGIRPLTIYIEHDTPRTTPQFGMVKSGANYVMALGPTLDAKRDHVADQVLFATGGDVTETGAANFFLVDDERVITRNLDESFLHGVTRRSVIQIAKDLGYEVEERAIHVDELKAWAEHGEMFLSGTAAVIAPVGKVIVRGETVQARDGQPGANTLKLREALTSVQTGRSDDVHGWLTPIG